MDYRLIQVKGRNHWVRVEDEDRISFSFNLVSFSMIKVPGTCFYAGETLVTQELWELVMGSNPSMHKGDPNLPVERVSLNDCLSFIDRLNGLTNESFRLPSVDEWIIAAKGGTKTKNYKFAGSDYLEEVAWCCYNHRGTKPVKQKKPNEIGLYDMNGNVQEWTISECELIRHNNWMYIGLEMPTQYALCGGSFMHGEYSTGFKISTSASRGAIQFNNGMRLFL